MKQIIYILAILSSGQICYGQEARFYVPTYLNGDTTLWFKWQQEKFEKAGLKNLTKPCDTLHIRFSSETQALDIWTNDYLTFSASLANFTTSYNDNEHKRRKNNKELFYSEVISLDTAQARKAYDMFLDKAVLKLAPQDSIKGWTNGEDGITYFVEYSTPQFYSFKEYWTPSNFKDKLDEAKRLHELTQELEKSFNLGHSFNQFIHTLPYGTYRAGGIVLMKTSRTKNKRK